MSEETWKSRILRVVDARLVHDGVTDNELSVKCGNSRNYLSQLRAKDADRVPRVAELQRLCDCLDVSLIHVLTGIEMDPEGEELIRLVANKPRALKRHVIGLLQGIQPPDAQT